MPTETMPEINPAKRYSAALDSVNLINDRIATATSDQTAEQRRSDIERNVEHLKIAASWDIWTNEDLAPINTAIANGQNWLSSNL